MQLNATTVKGLACSSNSLRSSDGSGGGLGVSGTELEGCSVALAAMETAGGGLSVGRVLMEGTLLDPSASRQ